MPQTDTKTKGQCGAHFDQHDFNSAFLRRTPQESILRRYDMNGISQMQGGKKNCILPKEINANRFCRDSHWLEIWKNLLCPCMGPNGGSVAMDSGPRWAVNLTKPVFWSLKSQGPLIIWLKLLQNYRREKSLLNDTVPFLTLLLFYWRVSLKNSSMTLTGQKWLEGSLITTEQQFN